MAEHLPEDLMTEILCRLPLKSLVGFKRVSKRWNNLIYDVCIPRIVREPTPLSGFLFHARKLSTPGKEFVDYVSCLDDGNNLTAAGTSDEGFLQSYFSLLPSEYSPYDVLDCCNGLILLGSSVFPRYYVCNPATKQCVAIPKAHRHEETYSAALAFDPRESLHYKVIRFEYALCCSASKPPSLDIFSSETREWTSHKVPIEPPVAYGFPLARHSVYSDGKLYRLCLSKHLLCFDLKALTAQAVEVPCKDEIDTFGFIGVSKGVLYYANHDPSRILIWQFDYDNISGCFWILKHSICIRSLKYLHPAAFNLNIYRNSSKLMLYAIHPWSDIIILGIPHMVFIYHLKRDKLRLFFNRWFDREISWGHGQRTFYPYTSCFVMLNDFTKPLLRSPQLETTLMGMADMKLETRNEDEEHI